MTLFKGLWTTRTALLALLLITFATSMALFLPAKADAVLCCGRRVTINYYSDASKTVWVGRCIFDDCAGTETCTGQQTAYYSSSSICCDTCG
jgi:hypothetical protein